MEIGDNDLGHLSYGLKLDEIDDDLPHSTIVRNDHGLVSEGNGMQEDLSYQNNRVSTSRGRLYGKVDAAQDRQSSQRSEAVTGVVLDSAMEIDISFLHAIWLYLPSTSHFTRAAHLPHHLPQRVRLWDMHWHRTGWRLVGCTPRIHLRTV